MHLIESKNLLVTILHPSELLTQEKEHPLLSFDIATVKKNLEFIMEEAHKCGKKVEYVTVAKIRELEKQGAFRNENE